MYGTLTLPAWVAAVKHGWTPSNFPTVTIRGLILWFSFRVKIGTNIIVEFCAKASMCLLDPKTGQMW